MIKMIYDAQKALLTPLITGYKIKLRKQDNQFVFISKILMIVYLLSGSSGQIAWLQILYWCIDTCLIFVEFCFCLQFWEEFLLHRTKPAAYKHHNYHLRQFWRVFYVFLYIKFKLICLCELLPSNYLHAYKFISTQLQERLNSKYGNR